jgi:hypothetical protein
LRPEVSKNSSTALSSNDGELVRSITTCAPAMASLRPSPVMLLTPLLGEAARTSCPYRFARREVEAPLTPSFGRASRARARQYRSAHRLGD